MNLHKIKVKKQDQLETSMEIQVENENIQMPRKCMQ